MGRYPEILRANHLIYFEAFPIFYSGFELLDPSKGIWRYMPFKDDAQRYHDSFFDDSVYSDVVYDPPLMHGVTEPPKLARFKQVRLNCDFVVAELENYWQYNEENGKLDHAARRQLADLLGESNMIENFVKLLAGCSWVDRVDLDIGLFASWDIKQSTPASSSPTEDPDLVPLVELKEIWHKGDIQVANIFLASGILDPLKRLSNVRSWCIELAVEELDMDPPFCMRG